MKTRPTTYLSWTPIIAAARDIALEYHRHGTQVTLRQLFYRLVAQEQIENSTERYNYLSKKTAEARRKGEFPELIENTRRIHEPTSWSSPEEAQLALIDQYRRDRCEYQPLAVYMCVEKATMVEQMRSWFGERGIPILALGGYASHTYVQRVIRRVRADKRDAVLLYAGDFDASGEDIFDDFVYRTQDAFVHVRHVALSEDQVAEYQLIEAPGKPDDTRAAGFRAKYGYLTQVELEALPPDDLHDLFEEELFSYWDGEAYQRSLKAEKRDIRKLKALLT